MKEEFKILSVDPLLSKDKTEGLVACVNSETAGIVTEYEKVN